MSQLQYTRNGLWKRKRTETDAWMDKKKTEGIKSLKENRKGKREDEK